MSVLNLEAKLERVEPTTPWGFRMQGGKDFSSALIIQRVNPGSLAAKCGLQVGDVILKIGNISTDILKHKEAQDMIIASGDKLDLLLQRIRDKPRPSQQRQQQRGGTQPQPTYEKFNTPSIFSLQNQQSPYSSQQNYNAAPKPFSSGGSSGMDNLTNRLTQGLSMSSSSPYSQPTTPAKPKYQATYDKYADLEDDKEPTQFQGKSFKRLQGLIDSGEVAAPGLRPKPAPSTSHDQSEASRSRSPNTVKAILNHQYNTPIGLYSGDNVATTFKGQAKVLTGEDIDIQGVAGSSTNGNGVEPTNGKTDDVDEFGRKRYIPSETYKLLKEQEQGSKDEGESVPTHSRTFKMLEKSLEGGPPPPSANTGPQPPWAQKQSKPYSASPASKPWAPAAPPAPSAPRAAQPRPTGQGGTWGKKGDAVYQKPNMVGKFPMCSSCGGSVRGPFVMAMGKTWCPDHFVCANPQCGIRLIDIGFVEEGGFLYCERDYAQHFAPHCTKCKTAVIGECVNALNGTWHPGCFVCAHCKQPIGGESFHQEDGKPYCENDWNKLFQTMCHGCDFPIEPGDRWVEAMNKNWHAECFNCQHCQVNLEGQPFYPKAGKPFCKKHMRP